MSDQKVQTLATLRRRHFGSVWVTRCNRCGHMDALPVATLLAR